MSNRAIRRHHVQRLKNNRKHYWYGSNSQRLLGILVHTAKICSCYICGNPRKFFKEKTIQEKRFWQEDIK